MIVQKVLDRDKTLRNPITQQKVRNPIDLTSERQICINGKMCELIDLSDDKVLYHECSHCNLLRHKIEQEEMPERSLTQSTTKKPRVTGPPRFLYDVFGQTVSYTPSFHVRHQFLLV
jgi:hypothetical protein